MPERWIQLVKEGYDAFNRGDTNAVIRFMGPGFSGTERPEAPEARSFAGDDAGRRALQVLREEFEDYRFEPRDFRIEGNWVVVRLRQSGRGRISGVPVEGEIVHAWWIEDDRGQQLRAFSTVEEALASIRCESAGGRVVRAWCAAANSGDLDAAVGLFDPDLELVYPDDFPGGGTHRGLEASRAAFESELEAWEDFRMEVLETIDSGEHVFAAIRESGRGRASGVETDRVVYSTWTLRGGRVASVRFFEDRAGALRHAGLDPGP